MKIQSRISRLILIAAAMSLLHSGCYARYLDEPPKEFYEYVERMPTPRAVTELAAVRRTYYAPREVCSGFTYSRLYGTQEDYAHIIAWYEEDMGRIAPGYGKELVGDKLTVFAPEKHGIVNISPTTAEDPVARLDFGEKTLRQGQEQHRYLLVLTLEHHYGAGCVAYPSWPG